MTNREFYERAPLGEAIAAWQRHTHALKGKPVSFASWLEFANPDVETDTIADCPFCLSESTKVVHKDTSRYRVVCDFCFTEGPIQYNAHDAIEEWNKGAARSKNWLAARKRK